MESPGSSSQVFPIDKNVSEDEVQIIISTIPRENGWSSSNDMCLYQHQGFWYYSFVLEKILRSLHLPSSSKLTLLCSAPKSGTTWLKALAYAISTRKLYPELKASPLLTSFPHNLIPYIELPPSDSSNGEEDDPHLSLKSTHLPYSSLPKSILDLDCKIVYIWRDPKDVFISLWHFMIKIRPNKDSTEPISLEEALDLFCRGVSSFGPYWDHILSYWKASLERPDKVFILRYEDMINDPILYVNRLAEFMGNSFSKEELMDGVDAKIVQTCSFNSLSNINSGTKTLSSWEKRLGSGDVMFRKGQVGDWKNYLTEEMANRVDQISATKLIPMDYKL